MHMRTRVREQDLKSVASNSSELVLQLWPSYYEHQVAHAKMYEF